MLLKILIPDRPFLEEQIDELTAPGQSGEFGVLPDHINFVTSLAIGEVSYRQGQKRRYIAVSGGFAEVLENVVTLIVPSAEFAEEIDREKALEERNRTQALLEKLDPGDAEFALSKEQLTLEETRLQAASRVQSR